MSAPTSIQKPRPPRGPVVRLDSFSNPTPRPIPRSKKQASEDCPNPECMAKNSGEMEDGKSICRECGAVISEGNLVSEVSYGLSGGAHVVHGVHVAADQAVSKRGAVYGDSQRREDSRQQTENFGKTYIAQIGVALGMPAHLRDYGLNVFRICIGGFIQGRRIRSVAAVALYVACRSKPEANEYMLIDFADILQLDVFRLGHIYKEMLKHMAIQGSGTIIQPINPEDLVLRFAQQLEFGNETMKVAKDTVRIVQRMKRDWMTPGRRPAGVCGAALIIAARMNNFRRTVREVVYVVKVQEQTIFTRLDEFKATESSGLTVDEFRTIDLERFADPPIWTEQHDPKVKKKRGRKRNHLEFDDDGDNNLPTVISSRASSVALSSTPEQSNIPANTQQAQLDSQIMPPPPIPIDPNLETNAPSHVATEPLPEASETTLQTPDPTPSSSMQPQSAGIHPEEKVSQTSGKRKRGRPPKNTATPPAIEGPALPADLTAAITDPMNIEHATALSAALDSAFTAPSSPISQVPRPPIPTSTEISDSEFADDPEVLSCLLTPEEVTIKTRIWTHENRDYIRAQTAKILKQQLAEANGTARIVVRRKRRNKRMGDMSAYGLGSDEEGRPVAGSPQEAVESMMSKRAFSKKINYGISKGLYSFSESSGSRRGSTASSAVASPGSGALLSGAIQVTSPGGTAKHVESPRDKSSRGKGSKGQEQPLEIGDDDDEGSVVSAHDLNEQQKERDAVAGGNEGAIEDEEEDEDEGPRTMYDEGNDGDDYCSD